MHEHRPENELTRDLKMLIELAGPISVADFMSHALQHPVHGYYTGKASQIGRAGDFVTAPEISQLFGEMIGVWCVATWQAMGAPDRFHLVELGPGKGTLMADLLRTTKQFPGFHAACTVHLVETSEHLRKVQMETLRAVEVEQLNDDEAELEAQLERIQEQLREEERDQLSKPPSAALRSLQDIADAAGEGKAAAAPEGASGGGPQLTPEPGLLQTPAEPVLDPSLLEAKERAWKAAAQSFRREMGKLRMRLEQYDGVDAFWHTSLQSVPEGPVLVVGQELLDALPVHQFEFTDQGWRERMVEVDDGTSAEHFRFTLAAEETPAVRTLLQPKGEAPEGSFDLSLGAVPGDLVEVCPTATLLVQDVATRIAQHRGGAIFIDYGDNHAFSDSLRGFYKHRMAHVLSRPGEVDLTANVDFASATRAVEQVPGARASHLVTQAEFLAAMGIVDRLEALIDQDSTTDDQAEALVASFRRLMDSEQMGELYKVMAVTDDRQPLPIPGFFPRDGILR